jgi:nuclear receptor co-repressor 1
LPENPEFKVQVVIKHCSQQTKEKVSRSSTGGEVKPRREPTSWTQDEETFAEILRNHGKDWRLLHESLPSKSLTQIKTYFQNFKAKLGFPTTEDMGNTGGRGGGTYEQKAEDSDTNSNNAGSGGPLYITRSLALYLLQRLISLPTRLSQE